MFLQGVLAHDVNKGAKCLVCGKCAIDFLQLLQPM